MSISERIPLHSLQVVASGIRNSDLLQSLDTGSKTDLAEDIGLLIKIRINNFLESLAIKDKMSPNWTTLADYRGGMLTAINRLGELLTTGDGRGIHEDKNRLKFKSISKEPTNIHFQQGYVEIISFFDIFRDVIKNYDVGDGCLRKDDVMYLLGQMHEAALGQL